MGDMATCQPSLRDFGHAECHRALKRPAIFVASRCDGGRTLFWVAPFTQFGRLADRQNIPGGPISGPALAFILIAK
jgi:hypothetical protein